MSLPLIIFGGLLIILSVFLLFVPETHELFPMFLFLGLLLTLEGIVIRYVYSKLASTIITLTDEGILFINNKENKHIKYEEITKLEYPSVKYIGGWIKIHSTIKNIRLTVVLKDFHEFLITLKERLDEHGLSDRYKGNKLFKFLKTSTYSEI